MCPILLEEAILGRVKAGKKPKACIVVHLYGMPAKMNEIIAICDKYEITLIEDAAEGLGSKYFDKMAGTMGDFGILSFNGNKIITTSGGGALICKTQEKSSYSKFLSTQSRDPAPHYEHSQIGYNYRMSNICAGIGRGQLEVLNKRVEKRRENYEYYLQNLRSSEVNFLKEPAGFFSNRWLSCIVLENFEQRESVRNTLLRNNIESRPLWKPMHLQPVFKDCPSYSNNFSEGLFFNGLCLPSGSNMSFEDLDRVVEGVKSAIG